MRAKVRGEVAKSSAERAWQAMAADQPVLEGRGRQAPVVNTTSATRRPPIASRQLVPLILWLLVACGPVALVLWATAPEAAAPVVTGPEPAQVVTDASVAADQAVHAVVTWLEATKDDSKDLRELYTTQVSTGRLPELAQDYEWIGLAQVTELAPGLWSVTVAADMRTAATDPAEGDIGTAESGTTKVRRYFEVAVAVQDGAGAPVTVPAPVPGPEHPATDVRYSRSVRATSPAWTSIDGFLRALLTGSGGLDRYVTPGVRIRPIEPAAYPEIDVADVRASSDVVDVPADGEVADVLVTVETYVDERSALTAEYRLELTGRGGRWEVSELQPAPQIQIKN